MASPLLIRSPNDSLYGYALSVSFKSPWVYDQDYALSRDPDYWEVVRKDPVVMSAMDRRARGIVRPWHVDPPDGSKSKADKVLASVVGAALHRIDMFNDARRRLAQAPILGRTYEIVHGEQLWCNLAGLGHRLWWVPRRLQHVDRRRFRWTPKHDRDGKLLGCRLSMFDVNRDQWVELSSEQRSRIISWTYQDTEDRLGYGRPLLEATYFYHYCKSKVFEKWMQGIDRWANGIIVGKLNSLRNASTTKTNDQLRSGMKTLLQNMRSEHIAVMQDGDDIDVKETSGAGHEMCSDCIRYLDEGIERLYNGSVLPSGHAEGEGSKARAQVEAGTSENFYQPDREALDEVLSRDLVGLFIYMNWSNLYDLGLHQAEAPHIDSEQEEREDPLEAVQVLTQANQLVDIGKSAIYKKLNIPQPEPDEEIVPARGMNVVTGPEMGLDGIADNINDAGNGKSNGGPGEANGGAKQDAGKPEKFDNQTSAIPMDREAAQWSFDKLAETLSAKLLDITRNQRDWTEAKFERLNDAVSRLNDELATLRAMKPAEQQPINLTVQAPPPQSPPNVTVNQAPVTVTLPAQEQKASIVTFDATQNLTDMVEAGVSKVVRKEFDDMKIEVNLNAPVPPAPIVNNVVQVPEQPAPVIQNTVNIPAPEVIVQNTVPVPEVTNVVNIEKEEHKPAIKTIHIARKKDGSIEGEIRETP